MDPYLISLSPVLGYLLVEFIRSFKDKDKENGSATKANTKVTQENTLAITELRGEVKALRHEIKPLIRLREDVNEAHAKIREMKAELKGKEGRC